MTPAKTDRPAIVRQLYLTTADYLGGLDHLGGPGGHSVVRGVWSYNQTPRYRVNDAPLYRSRSPAAQLKHCCYIINVCATETDLSPQSPTLHVCACLCASPAPSPSTAPVHGLLETAARGKQRVVVCRLVPRSSHARQKANNERIRV